MTLATITVASHHFVVNGVSARMRAAVNEFSRTLVQYSLQKVGRGRNFQEMPFKVFSASTGSRNEFRYHINHLEDFKKVLSRHRIDDHLIEWKKAVSYEAAPMTLQLQPHLSPRPNQVDAINYITDPSSPVSKAVILQAGGGKTLLAMAAAGEVGERLCVVLRPKYISQWLRDFKQNTTINPKRIVVLQGGKDLKSLLIMAENGDLPYDVVIVSADTFRGYISAYEEHEDKLEEVEGYVVPPYKFFEHIKAGLRFIDEGHEIFHFFFKLDLYTNIKSSVLLSATLFADNPFVNKMMQVAYPQQLRHDKGGFSRYVIAYSLHYSLRKPSEIRVMGSMGYSHIEFEKSMMKNRNRLDAYFNMVRENLRYTYDLNYQKGDKALVYFATIELCTLFTEYLAKLYPYHDVRRFCQDDPFSDLMEADISISTVLSAGTGKDIPMLTAVILTVNIKSSPSNLQGFGRLRDLNKNDPTLGRRMYFVSFCCDDFEKHIEYDLEKKELLKNRALSYEKRFYGTMF